MGQNRVGKEQIYSSTRSQHSGCHCQTVDCWHRPSIRANAADPKPCAVPTRNLQLAQQMKKGIHTQRRVHPHSRPDCQKHADRIRSHKWDSPLDGPVSACIFRESAESCYPADRREDISSDAVCRAGFPAHPSDTCTAIRQKLCSLHFLRSRQSNGGRKWMIAPLAGSSHSSSARMAPTALRLQSRLCISVTPVPIPRTFVLNVG